MGRGNRKTGRDVLFDKNPLNSSREEKEKRRYERMRKAAEAEPPTRIDESGTCFWEDDSGRAHRDFDLPAIVWSNGNREWCLNGELHRIGGPAVEYSNGDKEWWEHNERGKVTFAEDE